MWPYRPRHSGRCFNHLTRDCSCLRNSAGRALSARLPCSGRLPLNIHPGHSESPPPLPWPAVLSHPVSVNIPAPGSVYQMGCYSLVLFERFLTEWHNWTSTKFLTRSCSFYSHFQTLGVAPTRSLECLFFFSQKEKQYCCQASTFCFLRYPHSVPSSHQGFAKSQTNKTTWCPLSFSYITFLRANMDNTRLFRQIIDWSGPHVRNSTFYECKSDPKPAWKFSIVGQALD